MFKSQLTLLFANFFFSAAAHFKFFLIIQILTINLIKNEKVGAGQIEEKRARTDLKH